MHVHFSGMEAVKVALYVIVILGTLNLLAMRFQNSSSLAASWCNLWGIN